MMQGRFARTQLFEGPGTAWVKVASDKWKLDGCTPVMRSPQGTWSNQSTNRTQPIWFIPEMFGADDTADPNEVISAKWFLCMWDAQAGRWVAISSTGDSSGTSTDIVCCDCERKELFLSLENTNITWSLIKPSPVSGGNVTHTIKLTCTSDGATRNVQLDALSCSTVACTTKDMTGEFVGACEIGVITYGNDNTCAVTTGEENTECTANLPPYRWSDSSVVVSQGGTATYQGFQVLTPEFEESATAMEVNVQADKVTGIAAGEFEIIAVSKSIRIIWNFNTGVADYIRVVTNLPNQPQFQNILLQIPFDTNAHTLKLEQSGTNLNIIFDNQQLGFLGLGNGPLCSRSLQDLNLFSSGNAANSITLHTGSAGYY